MRFRPVVSVIVLAAYLPACTSYQATTQPLAELTASPERPEHLRVTTNAGAQLDFNAPRVAHDTLYGSTWITGAGGQQSAGIMAVPVADIRTVEVRKADGTKTLMLVGGIVGGILLLGAAGCGSQDYGC